MNFSNLVDVWHQEWKVHASLKLPLTCPVKILLPTVLLFESLLVPVTGMHMGFSVCQTYQIISWFSFMISRNCMTKYHDFILLLAHEITSDIATFGNNLIMNKSLWPYNGYRTGRQRLAFTLSDSFTKIRWKL